MTLPDWTTGVKLYAVDGDGNFLPVLVDDSGRMYVVVQGLIEGIAGSVTVEPGDDPLTIEGTLDGVTNPVDVSQTDSVREVQGADGATLRTLVVDANGQLIMVPRGQSGYYLAVDASGYMTTIIKGIEGANLRTLAVDASGNLLSVIKANDEGTLRTVACDPDGNIKIVPYDPADVWGKTVGMGLAELASILTPCKRYDRRGNIVFWDSFEDGLGAWITSEQGTGASVLHSAKRSAHGGYSVELVGGSDGNRWGAIGRNVGYPSATKHGLEAHIAWGSDVEYVRMDLTFRDGTTYYQGSVRYDPVNDSFEYMDSGAAWQDIDATKVLFDNDYVFHRIKFVIDVTAKEYVRALLDDEEYDLSGIDLYSTASGSSPATITNILIYSTSGNNGTGYVDSVIITENEPS